MTNIEALQNYLEPYALSDGKLELLLMEQGLQASEAYSLEYRVFVIRALIQALYACITLTEEKDNGSTQKYDVASLLSLIRHWKKDIGEPEEEEKKCVRDATREGVW